MSNLLARIEFGLQALVCHQDVCPFCQGSRHSVVARKHKVVRIRHCDSCRLYFTDPIYRSRVGNLYESMYTAEGSTTTTPDDIALTRLKATGFAESDKHCESQIRALQRLGSGRRLLEIGSSWGYFLYQAQAAGFAGVGVEPGRRQREFGVHRLGVDIRPSIDAVTERDFDVVYSAHTLEHIPEVRAFLADCHARLKAGGLLVIEVPHFDLKALGARVLPIIGAVHPLGLSQPFFEAALPCAGFTCTGMFADWPCVPSSPTSSAREGNLIVIGRKAGESSTGAHRQ
jgi:SAM-dependent methyltransferase